MLGVDTTAVSTDQTASPLTWNHTCSGLNRLLVVAIGLYSGSGTQPTTTAVTYGGVSMTKVRGDQKSLAGPSTELEMSMWLLYKPLLGTNQVSATLTLGGTPHAGGVSVSYYNAEQVTAADASNGLTGVATGDQTFTVTTIKNGCWVVLAGINSAAASPTLVADQTSRATMTLASTNSSVIRIADTNNAAPAPGSKTVGFVVGGTSVQDWAMTGFSFPSQDSYPLVNKLRPRIFAPGVAR